MAETRIRRTTRTLDHAGSLIELSVDRGEVVAGDRSAPLGEVEFELVEGDPNALFDAAAELFDDGLVRFSERSKADRAHLLATEGRIADPPAPRKARAVALDREMTTAEAAQAVLGACFEQVSANAEAVIATENSEAVHQLRVGLRRLRTALRILPKEHQPARMVALLDEAKRIGQAAGPVRDLDVMREDVLGPAAEAEPLPGWASLVRALDARAGPSREALRGALSDARTQRFLIDLAAISAAGPRKRPNEDLTAEQMRRPAIETVRDALRRAWKRVKKRAKGIEELDPEGRHELRKALKRLRYTVEFSAALYPADAVKPFVKRLRRLQNVFGELNDLAMAERVLAGDEPPARTVPEARYAAGLLIGGARRRSEERWGEAKAAWKTLKKAGPYW